MRDQDMVNDILSGTKASINTYTTAITECSSEELRSTLQTLRNEESNYNINYIKWQSKRDIICQLHQLVKVILIK